MLYGFFLGGAFLVSIMLLVVTGSPFVGVTLAIAVTAYVIYRVLPVPNQPKYFPTKDEKRQARRLLYKIGLSRWTANIFVIISIIAGFLALLH
jgi:hypothetical protein